MPSHLRKCGLDSVYAVAKERGWKVHDHDGHLSVGDRKYRSLTVDVGSVENPWIFWDGPRPDELTRLYLRDVQIAGASCVTEPFSNPEGMARKVCIRYDADGSGLLKSPPIFQVLVDTVPTFAYLRGSREILEVFVSRHIGEGEKYPNTFTNEPYPWRYVRPYEYEYPRLHDYLEIKPDVKDGKVSEEAVRAAIAKAVKLLEDAEYCRNGFFLFADGVSDTAS